MIAAAAPTLYSYSNLREARPRELQAPHSHTQLLELFARANREGRKVTLRAAGRSFDDQALNRDLVIDISRFNRILKLDVARREITLEPGVSWSRVLDATLPHGLIPHILVTTPSATAGGTLSANCLSRSSPRHGHTGDHIRAFTLLTPSGERLRCSREEEPELFHAVIGGYGWFGWVAEVTFDLLAIGAKQRVRTEIERREGLSNYLAGLTEASLNPGDADAVYSVFSLKEPQRGAVFHSSYTEEPLGKRLFLHQPWAWYRPIAELLFASSTLGNAFCHASYKYIFNQAPFVDELRGYTFAMEGNERTKSLLASAGLRMRTLQPSYTLPTQSFPAFLDAAKGLLERYRVYPSLLDAVYRPASNYLLCSSNRLAGFNTSFSFEGLLGGKYQRLARCLPELAAACADHGGRVHLVKCLSGSREQLRAMYAHALPALSRLKARVDPRGVLTNDFFSRAFGA